MARKTRTPDLDQFYTPQDEAEKLANWVKEQPWFSKIKTIIEPSAGTGAISQHFPGCYAYDLEPKADGIVKKNWFDVEIETQTLVDYSADIVCDPATTLVIGNPPFGNATSLAVQFLLKACSVADNVVMIVPYYLRKYPDTHALLRRDILKCEFDRPDGTKKPVNVSIQHYQKCWLPAHKPASSDDYIKHLPRGKDKQFYLDNADFGINFSGGKLFFVEKVELTDIPQISFTCSLCQTFSCKDKGVVDYLRNYDWSKLYDVSTGLAQLNKQKLGDILAAMTQPHNSNIEYFKQVVTYVHPEKDGLEACRNADFGILKSGAKLRVITDLSVPAESIMLRNFCMSYNVNDKSQKDVIIDYLKNYNWKDIEDKCSGVPNISQERLSEVLMSMPQPHQPDNDYYKQFFTRITGTIEEMRAADFGLVLSGGRCWFYEELITVTDHCLDLGFTFVYKIHEDKEDILDYLRNYNWDDFAARCTGQASISNQRLSDIMREYE